MIDKSKNSLKIFSIRNNVEKELKKRGVVPEKAIVLPIVWRKHVPLADEFDDVSPPEHHAERMIISDGLLNIIYGLDKAHKMDIENVIIREMKNGYKNI